MHVSQTALILLDFDLSVITVVFFVQMINSAQDRLWIASPYFVPDSQVIAALQLASLRGVDVRIMLPIAGRSVLR